MSYLYIIEQGAKLSIKNGRFEVHYSEERTKSIPVETLEVIEIFGNIHITTQAIQECLKRGINILYFSTKGSYYGRLISTNHVNVLRQRKQSELYKSDKFKLQFSKKIINAKINNQIVLLRRWQRSTQNDISKSIEYIKQLKSKIDKCDSIEEIMGYEGIIAKEYFKNISIIIQPEFKFKGRSKRPPKDPFNSMISLGYSILLNEIYAKLEGKGLNPYFGFMHKDKEKHPTLASDLLEEWRSVLIDSLVVAMINGNEIKKEDFYMTNEENGVYLKKEGFKKYITKLENKMRNDNKYLSYINYAVSFRKALDLQINELVKAIELENADIYKAIEIR
ncbi:CRISPR-associated endonuclease Cas1 [Fusobacterium hominis]|uniref:CRISPR-associated endonuclease Cas1 n=1 Tax=Fusobacterium hominis TaxID=2764326 RepID=UPI0015A1C860|nr:CRISPR-associated endonuclease Cas1 [Fusobacterium hominis]